MHIQDVASRRTEIAPPEIRNGAREGSPSTVETSPFRDRFCNWSGPASVCLSFDIDFAPDYMLADVLDRLDAAGVGGTFFVTHPTPLLERIAASPAHELAIHPFNSPESTQGDGLADIADTLVELCTAAGAPAPAGNRFHRLQFAYRDLNVLAERGIRYDCSTIRLNAPYQLPAHHADLGITLMSYSWEDGTYEAVSGATGAPMEAAGIDLTSPGMKILTFHPLNIYLNTARPEDRWSFFEKAPDLTAAPESVGRAARTGGLGAGHAFDGCLARIAELGLETPTMGALAEAFTGAAAC